jgi:hypothetical protein
LVVGICGTIYSARKTRRHRNLWTHSPPALLRRYYNFFDRKRELGGFLRIGNRVHEGHAEMTVCLFRPDNKVPLDTDTTLDRYDNHETSGGVLRPIAARRASVL